MSEKLGWVVQVAVGGQGRNGKSSLCRTRSRDPVDQEWGFVKLRWNLVRYLSVVGWLAGIVRSAQGRTEGGDRQRCVWTLPRTVRLYGRRRSSGWDCDWDCDWDWNCDCDCEQTAEEKTLKGGAPGMTSS